MSVKLNINKVESYSQALAEKLCNEFYKANAVITGEQILNLTPVPQVNLFILYNLFEKWKEETSKLKSPYFNYDQKEVKDSLNKFLNLLSQYISIEKEFFKPLLWKASIETLHWAFSPEEYISNQYKQGRLSNLARIQEFEKYVRFNKILITELIAILERNRKQEFSGEELVFYFSQVYLLKKTFIEDPASVLDQFSALLSFDIHDILPVSHQRRLEPLSDELPEKPQQAVEEAQVIEKNEVPEVEEPSFIRSQLTLNDMLMQSDNSLNKKLAKTKLNDIRSAISLNKRFEFINTLFKGEASEYNVALSEVENSASFTEALKLLNDKYSRKFDWKKDNTAMEEFLEIVERKFL